MHPTRIFKTPQDLAKAWEEFKEDLKEQARDWPKVQYVGKDGERMVDYPVLPITLEGFYRFCRGKYGDVKEYFVNRPNDGKRYYDEFTTICHACKDECREHQIIGGMIGNFNPSITQRLNGLKEHTDTVSTTSIQILNIDPLSSIE
jgi:hypothetical protein